MACRVVCCVNRFVRGSAGTGGSRLWSAHVCGGALAARSGHRLDLTRLGAGWRRTGGTSFGAFAIVYASSTLALDGSELEAGVGTFVFVAVVTPALAMLAASAGRGVDAVALLDGVVFAGAVLALLVYACSQSSPLLAALAWILLPVVARTAGERTGGDGRVRVAGGER